MNKISSPYQTLCAEFYELDKPFASSDSLNFYLEKAKQANGRILEPMCGTGRYFIPLLEKGYDVTGFDHSAEMVRICKIKCDEKGCQAPLLQSFEEFSSKDPYQLIIIPSGSLCLLENPKPALKKIHQLLAKDGKFIFEIEGIGASSELPGISRTRFVRTKDGSLILCNFSSHFEKPIETILCRYEHWENNKITRTEVEELRIRLYEIQEMNNLLNEIGFKVESVQIPYTDESATDEDPVILYTCSKNF